MDQELLNPALSFSSLVLSSVGNKVAMTFRVPQTGTITGVALHCASVTTPSNASVGFYTIDSSGIPTSTPYGGMTATTVSVSASGVYEVTLTGNCSAVAGDDVAMVIEMTTLGSWRFTTNNYAFNLGFPHTTQNGSKQGQHLVMAVKYSTGYTNIPGVTCAYTGGDVTYNNGTSTKELGNIFVPPVDCTVYGALAWINTASSGNFDVVLYNTGKTVLASVSMTAAQLGATGAYGTVAPIFTTPVNLSGGTSYYLMVKPTTANNMNLRALTFLNSSVVSATMAGSNTIRADYTTSFSTTNTQRILIAPIFSGIGISPGGPNFFVSPGKSHFRGTHLNSPQTGKFTSPKKKDYDRTVSQIEKLGGLVKVEKNKKGGLSVTRKFFDRIPERRK